MKGKCIMRLLLAVAFLLPAAGFAQKVVVTKNGDKYHLDKCRTITGSSDVKAMDVAEAKAAKLSACSVCKPPTQPATGGAQCTAKTKDGARCKRMTQDKSGKCWQHS